VAGTAEAPTTKATDAHEPCPACGQVTLTAAGRDEVCSNCGWQDDPASRANETATSRENGLSLRQARWNVEQFGLAFPPSEVGV
jgi:ribosomal protein L37E